MDFVIVSQYLRDIESLKDNNSRFVYLAKMLSKNSSNKVEIITSDFSHGKKQYFAYVDKLPGVKVTALHESGYPKNVCLKRFVSHRKLANNVSKYLNKREKPSIIYVAVPSLVVADACAKYCKKNKVRFIVDIQDLWPEAFKMVFNIPLINDIVFYPMYKQANRIYSAADQIVAVSETYAMRGMKVNKKSKTPIVAYLGTEKKKFDRYAKRIERKSDEIIIVYIGSLGASYDLVTVIDAIARIALPVKLLVMGDGSNRKYFEIYAHEKGICAEFTGSLSYPEMVRRLVNSDIAVNPIHKGSAASIVNKVNDYAMAGLPVVNTQESKEYRKLLEAYGAGINCECENCDDVYDALMRLIQDKQFRINMGKNSRKLGEEKIDRAESYKKILLALCGENNQK